MKTNEYLIFIVEDDVAFNKLISSFLTFKNVGMVKSFFNGEDCLSNSHEYPGIVVMDYDLPAKDGLETMKEFKKYSPGTEFIFLSGQGDVKKSLDIISSNVFGYIFKDIDARENVYFKIIELQKILVERNNKSKEGNSNSTIYY